GPTFQDWARREAARARAGEAPPSRGELDPGELPPLAADRPPRRSGQQWQAPPPWLRPAGASGPGSPSRAPGSGDGAGAASGAAAAGAAGAAATGGLAGSFADRLASGSGAPPVSPAAVSPRRDDWDDEIDAPAP